MRDPGGLTATSTITVQVLSPAGKIGTFSLNSSGQPVMQFAGIPNFRYAIERSPDLATWQTVHTITAPAAGSSAGQLSASFLSAASAWPRSAAAWSTLHRCRGLPGGPDDAPSMSVRPATAPVAAGPCGPASVQVA